MSKKTIKINPELFQVSSEKTKKNRGRVVRPIIPAIVNPNSIKKQLLNKIKEHKQQENKSVTTKTAKEEKEFSDEFNDSIEYLSSLSKKQKETPLQQPKKNESLSFEKNQYLHVELDLPEELCETSLVASDPAPVKINPREDNNIPYGCLKNGSKPTYRTWKQNQTKKNYSLTNNSISFSQESNEIATIAEPEKSNNLTKFASEREKKLAILRSKLKKQEEEDKEQKIFETPLIIRPTAVTSEAKIEMGNPENSSVEKPKSISIKKTIRRKYNLGKSTKYRKVGILIKDKQTRKRIIEAEKELKKKSIQDVKKYLKDRGLIKAGSNAPNDVLRKTFESAILSGEITNLNHDTLLHNLLNENSSF